MYIFQFTIPGLPPTTNSHGRAHWAVKTKIAKEWKAAVYMMTIKNKPKKPLLKAKITLTRHSSSCPDADGLTASFKHILDGLTFSSVIKDDNMQCIGFPEYKWVKTTRGKGFVTVRIQELPNEPIESEI